MRCIIIERHRRIDSIVTSKKHDARHSNTRLIYKFRLNIVKYGITWNTPEPVTLGMYHDLGGKFKLGGTTILRARVITICAISNEIVTEV